MLNILFHNNDSSGTDKIGNYDYYVYVNSAVIDTGKLENHIRGNYKDLIIQLAEQFKEEKNDKQ